MLLETSHHTLFDSHLIAVDGNLVRLVEEVTETLDRDARRADDESL